MFPASVPEGTCPEIIDSISLSPVICPLPFRLSCSFPVHGLHLVLAGQINNLIARQINNFLFRQVSNVITR